MKEIMPQSEYAMTMYERAPIKRFTGDQVPQQQLWEGQEEYEQLAEMQLIPIKIATVNVTIYAGIAMPIHGGEISALSHFGAPNKAYGHDWEDYVNDEYELYHPNTHKEHKRLFDHRQIKNWHYFERIRERVTETIKVYREGLIKPPPTLTSIIQFRKEGNDLTMDFDLHQAIANHIEPSIWDTDSPPLDSCLSELGPLLVAAYSPDITQKWPKYDTYPGECTNKNPMAATQFIPYSLWKADELVNGKFARNFIYYCETGSLKSATQSHTEPTVPFPDEPNPDNYGPVW